MSATVDNQIDAEAIGGRLLRITTWLALIGAGAIVAGAIVNHYAFDDDVFGLDAAHEISFNNWITVVATFGAALAAALHALILPLHRLRLGVLAAVLAFLSLDDLVRMHERIGDRIGIDHVEIAVFAPAYAVVFVIVWRLPRESRPQTSRVMRLGLMVLVAAVAVDLMTGLAPGSSVDAGESLQSVRVATEEGLEVGGWILVAGAIVTWVFLSLLSRSPDGPRSQPSGEWGAAPEGVGRRARREADDAPLVAAGSPQAPP